MNREQRRAAAKEPEQPLAIEHGHNGEKVMVIFSRPISNLLLTPAQVDATCDALQLVKGKLLEHLGEKKP